MSEWLTMKGFIKALCYIILRAALHLTLRVCTVILRTSQRARLLTQLLMTLEDCPPHHKMCGQPINVQCYMCYYTHWTPPHIFYVDSFNSHCHASYSILYINMFNTVHIVYCTYCILYILYNVHIVYCTYCIPMSYIYK